MNFCCNAGFASAALMAAFSFAMISGLVFAGAVTPNQ